MGGAKEIVSMRPKKVMTAERHGSFRTGAPGQMSQTGGKIRDYSLINVRVAWKQVFSSHYYVA